MWILLFIISSGGSGSDSAQPFELIPQPAKITKAKAEHNKHGIEATKERRRRLIFFGRKRKSKIESPVPFTRSKGMTLLNK
jgi:hypothetical protein